MQLERGITIAVLPRFRHTLLTPAGIRLNSGVECLADRFAARNDWQCPNDKELAVLVGSESDAPEEPTKRIELFEIPGHLYKQWGEAAEELAAAPGEPSERYERFVHSLASFLTYKKVQVENATFNVIAARPPEESALGMSGCPGGLGIGDGGPLLATNLGEEPTSLIFLNLPIERMSELNNSGVGLRIPSVTSQNDLWHYFQATPPCVSFYLHDRESGFSPTPWFTAATQRIRRKST